MSLLVLSTHPIQYHAPVYRTLQQSYNVPTTVIYGSDFSIAGYKDREFGTQFAWDSDLLSGYSSVFLSRVAEDGAQNDRQVRARGIYRAIREVNPSAILLLGYRLRFDLPAFFAARMTGVPLLFRAETNDNTGALSLKRRARDLFLGWFYHQFAAILPIGHQSRQHYLRLGVPDHKFYFSPYCVDTTPFQLDALASKSLRTKIRHELEIGDDEIAILYVGKFAPIKRLPHLVNAIKDLSISLRARVHLVMVGSGELLGEVQALAERAPRIQAHFVGFKNQTELSAHYHAADLFVLPSHTETWGLVVNEALHHGLPCVVSDRVGSGYDLIESGRTGNIFTANSVPDLSRAIAASIPLTQSPETASYCRERVSHYTVDAAARGLAEAYRAVCEI